MFCAVGVGKGKKNEDVKNFIVSQTRLNWVAPCSFLVGDSVGSIEVLLIAFFYVQKSSVFACLFYSLTTRRKCDYCFSLRILRLDLVLTEP